jgi:hypothetical protein
MTVRLDIFGIFVKLLLATIATASLSFSWMQAFSSSSSSSSKKYHWIVLVLLCKHLVVVVKSIIG